MASGDPERKVGVGKGGGEGEGEGDETPQRDEKCC
jgi:hypothetical protein